MADFIEVKNVTKKFRVGKTDVRPLRGVSFLVEEGEFVIINGPSGCGKTTLLNLIAGLEKSDAGQISIFGRDINTYREIELETYRRRIVGMVFQNFNLINSLNVIGNVVLSLEFFGVPRKERVKRAQEILGIIGLKDKQKNYPTELSGGEQQRVAIARALAGNPKILIVDEPTGNLDSVAGREVMDLLLEINQNFGTTILLVTHDQSYLNMGDRVLYMEDGRIIKQTKVPSTSRQKATNPNTEISNFTPSKTRLSMGLFDLLSLSYNHFTYARTRTFLTTLGLIIGISAIVLLVSLGFGLQNITTSSLASLNSLETISVTAEQTNATVLNDANIKKIERIENVSRVSPVRTITASGTLNGTSTGLIVNGYDPKDLDVEQVITSEGSTYANNTDQILISDNALKNFAISNTSDAINQNISIAFIMPDSSNSDSTVPTVKNVTFKIVGVVSGQITPEVFTSLDELNSVYSAPYDRADVIVKNRSQISSTENSIQALGFNTTASSDLVNKVNKAFTAIEIVLALVGGIGLIVASFGIINTMTISLLERTHEIGIMKALGISVKDIKKLFIYESSFYGLFGGIIGVGIGWIAGISINVLIAEFVKKTNQNQSLHLFVTPWKFAVLILIFSILIARFAGYYPARRAAKSSPLEALRYE